MEAVEESRTASGLLRSPPFVTKILPTVWTISRDTPCSIHATSGEFHSGLRSPVARMGGRMAQPLRRLLLSDHSNGLLVG